jgi:hypothetical protein
MYKSARGHLYKRWLKATSSNAIFQLGIYLSTVTKLTMKSLFIAFLAMAGVQATPSFSDQPKDLHARAVDLKVQYYKDGGCKDFAVQFSPGTSNRCYGYSYSNTNSANIVSCGGSSVACTCYMFEQDNCKGNSVRTVALSGSGSSCIR